MILKGLRRIIFDRTDLKSVQIAAFVTLIGFSLSAHCRERFSAIRLPNQDWKQAAKEGLEASGLPHTLGFYGRTALDAAQAADTVDYKARYQDLGLGAFTADQVSSLFARGRDERFLFWSTDPSFLRRSTWLYPDDGCFARAALFVQNALSWAYPSAGKIFVFGNLRVQSEYSPSGSVTWWYHVAPLVYDGQEMFVMDPALDSSGPLPVRDWLGKMTQDISTIQTSVCNTHSYGPYSSCNSSLEETDRDAERDQKQYLDAEWSRLIDVSKDPNQELGDFPPWRKKELTSAL